MTRDHARAILTRLAAVEAETREAMRTIRDALDDLASAHETARQLRAELAAVLDVPDIAAAASDASRPADPVPDPDTYARLVMGGPCGRVRR